MDDDPSGGTALSTPGPDALAPLRERLAAILLVTITAVTVVSAAASCAIAVLGQLGALDTPPFGPLVVAAAGAAGMRLLGRAYSRTVEPPDIREIPPPLR